MVAEDTGRSVPIIENPFAEAHEKVISTLNEEIVYPVRVFVLTNREGGQISAKEGDDVELRVILKMEELLSSLSSSANGMSCWILSEMDLILSVCKC